MQIKGIVEKYEGFGNNLLVINLSSTSRVIVEKKIVDGIVVKVGEKYATAWKNEDFPKTGSIVRINFHAKDRK